MTATKQQDNGQAEAISTTTPGSTKLEMKVDRQTALVRRALEDEKGELQKLAAKVQDCGYVRESRVILGDSRTIGEDLLPQLAPQAELAFDSDEDLRARISNCLRSIVRSAVVDAAHIVATVKGAERETITKRIENDALERLAIRIEDFGEALANRAYYAGLEARTHEPASLTRRALSALAGEHTNGQG